MQRLMYGAIVVFMGAVLNAAVAGPLQDAEAAYARGDYAAALRLMPPCEGALHDYSKAIRWLHDAADRGDAHAQFDLGNLYFFGRGVPRDRVEAAKWYRRAADAGNAGARVNLGYMYGEGLGVSRDYVQAHMWLELAASPQPGADERDKAKAVEIRDILTAKMTPEQIAEARNLAQTRLPR